MLFYEKITELLHSMLTNVTLSSIKLPSPVKVAVGTFVLESIFRIHAEKGR